MFSNLPRTDQLVKACRDAGTSVTPVSFNETVQVETGTWGVYRGDGEVTTGGLGPCFGLAILDPRSKTAIVAHILDPDHSPIFDQILNLVKTAFPDRSSLRVYLAGLAPLARDLDGCERLQSGLTKQLTDLGIKNDRIREQWSTPTATQSIDVSLENLGAEFHTTPRPNRTDEW